MAKQNANIEKIKELREEVASMLTISNAIVSEIWKLDDKIYKASGSAKKELADQKSLLEKQLEENKYSATITELKEQIYALEMEEYGESEILDKSPRPGNILF